MNVIGLSHEVPPSVPVLTTRKEISSTALVRVQARFVKPNVLVQVPVQSLLNAPATTVTAQPMVSRTFSKVTPIVLKKRQSNENVQAAMDVDPHAILQVPANAVHPDTLMGYNAQGPATLSSLAGPSSAQSLKKVNRMPSQHMVMVSPSMVDPRQAVKVPAEEVINMNADVLPAGGQKMVRLSSALNQGMPLDTTVTVEAQHVNPAAMIQAPRTSVLDPSQSANAVTAGDLNKNTLITATQPAVQPNLMVAAQATDPAQGIVTVPSGLVQPSQPVLVQRKELQANAVVQVPAQALKPNVPVLQSQVNGPLTTQTAQSPMPARQLTAINPSLPVNTTPSELTNKPVLVDNSAVLPAERSRVVQVSPTQSLAHRSQVRPQVLSVPVQNVKQNLSLTANTMGTWSTPRAVKSKAAQAQAQTGGAGSDFVSSFYANTVDGGPAAISAYTLQGIDNAPMFHPLDPSAVIPTMPSTGIFPTGLVMATESPDMSTEWSNDMVGGGRGQKSRTKIRK